MIKTILTFSTVALLLALPSCYYDKADKLYPNQTCDTSNVSYSAFVAPLLQSRCYSCHPGTSSISLKTYTDVQAVAKDGRLINALKYLTGGSKNMPPDGKLDACTVSKIEAWVKKGAPNN